MSVDELEAYFKNVEMPKEVKLTKGVTITDTRQFVDTQLTIIRHNAGDIGLKSLERLVTLKKIIDSNHNV